jgi:long-subunit fatty acid transport protein
VKLPLALATLVGAAAISSSAAADGGYYSGALGARAAGRSGAFAARADDPTAVQYNPAGLANIGGTVIMVGDRVSYNGYTYTRAPTQDWGHPNPDGSAPTVTFAQVHNETPWQGLEPLIIAASDLGMRDWGFALGAFAAPGASKFNFPEGGGSRYMMLSREAIILDYTASAAWKYHDLFGIGATAEWIYVPRLNYSLMVDGSPLNMADNPVSSDLDMVATTKGSDPFTFNAILGAWLRPRPWLQFGLAGQVVPASIETKSTLSITPVNLTMADPPVLTRDGSPANDVNVILPLPLMARFGARYRGLAGAREIFDVELDVEYETWSRVNQFTLDTHNLDAEFQGTTVSLGKIAIAKHWRDTVAFKLGGDWAVIPDRLALRGGAFYETAVADPAYANVDFPGGPMFGGSLGSSVAFGRWELAVAYQLRHQGTVSTSDADGRVPQQVPASGCAAHPADPASYCSPHLPPGSPYPFINAGTYNATSHYLVLALLYRFRP